MLNESPASTLTRRGQRSREALLNGAEKVFSEQGYSRARVSDIVAEAGLSTGAFYRYFKDKHDILVELLREMNGKLFRFSRSQTWSNAHMESVEETTRQYLALYRQNLSLMRVEIEVAQTDESVLNLWNDTRRAFFSRIERAVERAQASGLVRETIIPGLAAAMLGGMTEHYAYLAFVVECIGPYEDEVVADQIRRIWGNGVLSAKGRAPVASEPLVDVTDDA